jgi:DNA-binding transcriptional LysR family regulator
VRRVVEQELRTSGIKLRTRTRLELGLQESVKNAVAAGCGVGFISRAAIEGELAAGTIGAARLEGVEPARQIYLVRSATRALSRAAEAFVEFARGRAA